MLSGTRRRMMWKTIKYILKITKTYTHARSLPCTNAHWHTCTHSYAHRHIHTHAHTQTHTHARTHTHTHTHTHTNKHIHTQTYTHTHTHTHEVIVRVWVRACTRVRYQVRAVEDIVSYQYLSHTIADPSYRQGQTVFILPFLRWGKGRQRCCCDNIACTLRILTTHFNSVDRWPIISSIIYTHSYHMTINTS